MKAITYRTYGGPDLLDEHVVADRNLHTRQNPASSAQLARNLIDILNRR
ncbi:hypothetical protein [Streptomyces sp. 8N706]